MPKKLDIGDKAPSFSAIDVHGKPVNLGLISGYVLIVFLRYSGCPWCNLAIHRLTLEDKLLRENRCTVIAFVQSSKKNIMKNVFERHEKKPQFSIIADREMKVYKKYTVKPNITSPARMLRHIPYWVHAVRKGGFKQENLDGSLFIAPALFLLAPGIRKIISAEYGADLYSHSTFTKLYEAIQEYGLSH